MLSSVASSILYRADIIESTATNVTSKGMLIFYAALVLVFLVWAGKALWSGAKEGSWKSALTKTIGGFVAVILIGGAAMWLHNTGGEGASREGTSVVKGITGQ